MIDPDLLFDGLAEADQDALDEMVRAMDEALGEILKTHKPNSGETCKKCNGFYPHAEPNQADGTLICFSCRKYG